MKTQKMVLLKLLLSIVIIVFLGGCSLFENEDNTIDIPIGVTATPNSSSSIKISWNSVKNANNYNVYRSVNESGPYEMAGTTWSDTPEGTSYDDKGVLGSGLSSGRTYFYKVSAERKVVKDGKTEYIESSLSSSVSATTLLNAPLNVKAKANSLSSITVSWSSVTNAKHYYVYRTSDEFGNYNRIDSTVFNSYENNGLSANSKYFYKVSVVNNNNVESMQSSFVSATTF